MSSRGEARLGEPTTVEIAERINREAIALPGGDLMGEPHSRFCVLRISPGVCSFRRPELAAPTATRRLPFGQERGWGALASMFPKRCCSLHRFVRNLMPVAAIE